MATETWTGETCPHGYPVEFKTECPQCRIRKESGPKAPTGEKKIPPPPPGSAERKAFERQKLAEEQEISEIKKEISGEEAGIEKEPGGKNIFAATEKDAEKTKNQDAIAAGENYVLVADGLGGHIGGYEASHTVADYVRDTFEEKKQSIEPILKSGNQENIERLVAGIINGAQEEVAEAVEENPDLRGMGTTLTMALKWETPIEKKFGGLIKKGGEKKVTLGQVGDSRAYRFRDGALERVTKDDSIAQKLVDQGIFPDDQSTEVRYSINELMPKILEVRKKEALDQGYQWTSELEKLIKDNVGRSLGIIETAPKLIAQGHYRENEQGQKEALFSINEIKRGTDSSITSDRENLRSGKVLTIDAKKGDLLLVCSDGLTDMVRDKSINEILNKYQDNYEKAAEMLVIAAKIMCGQKNIEDYPELQDVLEVEKDNGKIKIAKGAKEWAKGHDDVAVGIEVI